MFPLFELAKILHFRYDKEGRVIKIHKWAYKEIGELSQVALLLTNGYVVLRHHVSGRNPIIRQFLWYPDKTIECMTFDPTGTWLLILVRECRLFIVPALCMLDSKAKVNQIWKIDDITEVKIPRRRGSPVCVTWWYTLADQHIAIVGTTRGSMLLIDLISGRPLVQSDVPEPILNIELIQNNSQTKTYALISTTAGNQWRLLLEKKENRRTFTDSELDTLGYEQIGSVQSPMYSIIKISEEDDLDSLENIPNKFYEFEEWVYLTPQYAKSRYFMSVYDTKHYRYQIHDTDVEQTPLFEYRVPEGATGIIFTDRLMFATQETAINKLTIIANQLAETSSDETGEFNAEAVPQYFYLPENEEIQIIYKKSFPFYWHEKQEEEARMRLLADQSQGRLESYPVEFSEAELSIQIAKHTVLDGCLIITKSAVYECRPRVSPERLFLNVALNSTDTNVNSAEQLGIMLGLDINALFEMAAELRLARGDCTQAVKLYQLSKCPHVRRVAAFAKYGRMAEVLTYVRQILSNRVIEMTNSEKRQLSNLALHSFVQQLCAKGKSDPELLQAFREFLHGNHHYDDKTAIKLLAEHSMMALMFEVSKLKSLTVETLEVLLKQDKDGVGDELQDLLPQAYNMYMFAQVSNTAFLKCLSSSDLVHLLSTKPQLAKQFIEILHQRQQHMTKEELMMLVTLFDLSQPFMLRYLGRVAGLQRQRKTSTSSFSSQSSMASFDLEVYSTESSDLHELVNFFVSSIILLSNKRAGNTFDTTFLTGDVCKKLDDQTAESNPGRRLASRVCYLACGQHHTALVRDGDLFIWGRTANGRLGLGDIGRESYHIPPSPMLMFRSLRIQVTAVSCGVEHTLALTEQGVYGWGSSKFGQVGVGSLYTQTRPQLIEELMNNLCVQVVCGAYHSLALTDDGSVYSWGWGIYGQLGHGNAEDAHRPLVVKALQHLDITTLAAGYSHSLALTAKGEIWSFGCGMFGQLGLGSTAKETLPQQITALPEAVRLISTKYFHNLAVTITDKLYKWGSNPQSLRASAQMSRRAKRSGQNVPPYESHLVPKLVDTSAVIDRIAQVSCGSQHNALLTIEGEVFTWGKNFDGQIGNGNRQEQREPAMVVKINDHKVAALDCGADYTICLDTKGTVFAWGKNEYTQAGIVGRSCVSQYPGSKRNTQMIDMVVPSIVKNLPTGGELPGFMSSIGYSQENEHWWSDDLYEYHPPELILPNFSATLDVPYDICIAPYIYKKLPQFFNLKKVLELCESLENWQTVADTYHIKCEYTQALKFRLKSAHAVKDNMNDGDFQSIVEQTVQCYTTLVSQCIHGNIDSQEEAVQYILDEVLDFWSDNDLPVSSLEKILSSHIKLVANAFARLLFRAINNPLLCQFTPGFLIDITRIATSDMTNERSLSHFSHLLDIENTDSIDISVLEITSSPEKLWQDITQSYIKTEESKNYVILPAKKIRELTTEKNDFSIPTSGKKSKELVAFTCGHNLDRVMFIESVITKWDEDLGQIGIPAPQTGSLITEYYRHNKYKPMACPECLLTSIHETL
ncbi:unnamed protein product [Owenia fusiformis]|uniref:RCC1-like domain-containing protein n=1 Tax=Owenia fusiformis TaxID=6347 RepID=A0A8S4NMM8_OWEFU|nr:unnamed protein product [Owenia fusiformis]CAH1782486.1 unnamed protein product [Owenia fusiformis]